MITIFNYKQKFKTHQLRYEKAYARGLSNISDWLTNGSGDNYTPMRGQLRDRCAELSGINHWHFVNCASDAIQAAVVALTKPGDKIIMPACSFIAVPQNVLWVNRQIVFCDVGPDSLMDLDSLKQAVIEHPDAAAVMVVHLLGRVQAVSKIREIIPKHMKIIEDAAEAFYIIGDDCEPPGTYSDVVCYSFDMSKVIGSTGNGGAVASHNEEIINTIREMTQQGFNRLRNDFISPACKSSMDDTSASIILEDIDIFIEHNVRQVRQDNHRLFAENIRRSQFAGNNIMCYMFCFYPQQLSPSEARNLLKSNGVQSYTYNVCFPTLSAFEHCYTVGHTMAEHIVNNHIRVACHEYLSDQQKELIIELASQT